MGPGAGVHGGHIIDEGTPADLIANKKSLTGRYLSGAENIPNPAQRRKPAHNRWLKVVGARGNNLKNVTLKLPVGLLTPIAHDLGISSGSAGLLISVPALLAAVFAPLVVIAAGGINLRHSWGCLQGDHGLQNRSVAGGWP